MAPSLYANRLVHVVRMRGVPILQQLRLEEALLRTDDRNWCLINDGGPNDLPPSVVMGISGKVPQLINADNALADGIPVIKRYSGGGTVIVDKDTIFATLMFNTEAVPNKPAFPPEIMSYTEEFYRPAFHNRPDFALREHDYVFGERKFGGNAQCITKKRWVHHTSFLWDFRRANMEYLKFPPKSPEYRKGRDHSSFLCTIRESVPQSRDEFLEGMEACVEEAGFEAVPTTLEEAMEVLEGNPNHIKTTKLVDLYAFAGSTHTASAS